MPIIIGAKLSIASMGRARWSRADDSFATLVDIVSACVGTDILWLKYGEKLDESPRENKTLLKHKHLIRGFEIEQENLSYSQRDVVEIMWSVLARKREELPRMSSAQEEDWCTSMSLMIRTMLQHCAQAKASLKVPAWYLKIVAVTKDQAQEQPSQVKPADTSEKLTFYGWDKNISRAWRQVGGKSRELADSKLFVRDCEAGSPEASAWARWPDGSEHEVAEVAAKDVPGKDDAPKQAPKKARTAQYYWQGVQESSGLPLVLRDRADKPGTCYISLFLPGDRQVVGLKKASTDDNGGKGYKCQVCQDHGHLVRAIRERGACASRHAIGEKQEAERGWAEDPSHQAEFD